MKKERAKLKQELLAGKNQLLLPFEGQNDLNMVDDGKKNKKQKLLTEKSEKEYEQELYVKSKKQMELKYDKSGLDKMQEFVADNFIEQTVSNHVKEIQNRRKIKAYEQPNKSKKSKYDPLLDGAVPSHFMDHV